jgi:hypothetical protein
LLGGQWAFFDARSERLALDKLHHQEIDFAFAADVVERADVRMIQRGDRAGFALETLAALRVRGKIRRQNLDRNVAPEARVARSIDFAHTAGAEGDDDFVGA